nr:DAZ-associated protein 1-like [Gorilla gorilla gorilla]
MARRGARRLALPVRVSGRCGAVRAPGGTGRGWPSWGGLGARWAAQRRGGRAGRPGPRVAMGTGVGAAAPPRRRGSRWRVGAQAGGGAGRGPRGRGAPPAPPPPPSIVPPAAPFEVRARRRAKGWGQDTQGPGHSGSSPGLGSDSLSILGNSPPSSLSFPDYDVHCCILNRGMSVVRAGSLCTHHLHCTDGAAAAQRRRQLPRWQGD